MKKAISDSLAELSSLKITIDINTSLGNLVINNPENQYLITLSDNLKPLFAVVISLRSSIIVKKFTSPTAYFIHCDLIDKEQNLLNGEPSSVLALFDIKGVPYEKIRYQTPQTYVLRDTSTGDYINSLTISVRNEKGKHFDFNGYPLELEIEINLKK